MPKDISIEYCHIYTNNKINLEHETSLKILSQIKAGLIAENKSMSLSVMIDDYSFPDPNFDYDELASWLDSYSLKPDFMFRESQLIPHCDTVLKLIDQPKLRETIADYIKTKKYPCSLFIATWYLIRLGLLESDIYDTELTARRLINILPESYRPYEEKGLDIIAATKHRGAVQRIDYHYFDGRLLAWTVIEVVSKNTDRLAMYDGLQDRLQQWRQDEDEPEQADIAGLII